MIELLIRYKTLLETVDRWFEQRLAQTGTAIACRRACSGCCRGLFEISLLDARLLQVGFSSMGREEQVKPLQRARQRVSQLQKKWPEFQPPFILNHLQHDDWQQMPEEDETPCPLLSDDGLCLVYAYRPMTCRLHGLPNIDLSGEVFSDTWCTLNFKGLDPLGMKELRWHFRQTFAEEFELLGRFSEALTGRRQLELDTFIPTALLIDFNDPAWRRLPVAKKRQES